MSQRPDLLRALSALLVTSLFIAGCKAPPPRAPKILGSTRAPSGMQAPPLNSRTPVLVPTAPVASPRPAIAAYSVAAPTAIAVPAQAGAVAVPVQPGAVAVQAQPGAVAVPTQPGPAAVPIQPGQVAVPAGPPQGQFQVQGNPPASAGPQNLPQRPEYPQTLPNSRTNNVPQADPEKLDFPPEP
jgi:hypothetical protein